jgi:hypothetical protein
MQHETVVTIYAVNEVNGLPYLVMARSRSPIPAWRAPLMKHVNRKMA